MSTQCSTNTFHKDVDEEPKKIEVEFEESSNKRNNIQMLAANF